MRSPDAIILEELCRAAMDWLAYSQRGIAPSDRVAKSLRVAVDMADIHQRPIFAISDPVRRAAAQERFEKIMENERIYSKVQS